MPTAELVFSLLYVVRTFKRHFVNSYFLEWLQINVLSQSEGNKVNYMCSFWLLLDLQTGLLCWIITLRACAWYIDVLASYVVNNKMRFDVVLWVWVKKGEQFVIQWRCTSCIQDATVSSTPCDVGLINCNRNLFGAKAYFGSQFSEPFYVCLSGWSSLNCYPDLFRDSVHQGSMSSHTKWNWMVMEGHLIKFCT